ncbi:MAG: ATP-dependent zinc protease [Phycisphaeraceae bacterium]|nr:ATP-dependent zinc protease [Phycisphaeraceae bacterium]
MKTHRRTIAALICAGVCVAAGAWRLTMPPLRAASAAKIQWKKQTIADIAQTHPLCVVGAVEVVHIEQIDLSLPARVDTGAASSSIDARDIETFERDGEKWVRFTVPARPLDRPFDPKEDQWPENRPRPKPVTCERPIAKTVVIISPDEPDEKRYEVRMSVVIGDKRIAEQFTLNNRSKLNYGVLLGRSLLSGKALVDVSRDRLHGEPNTKQNDASE